MDKITFVVGMIFLTLLNLEVFYISTEIQSNPLTFYFLDIGQGDSLVIKTPNNNWGMIDAGRGNFAIEEISRAIPPYVREIAFIVLTHPDADHIEGFIQILERFKVNTIFFNKTSKENEVITEIVNLSRIKNVTSYSLFLNNDFEIDGVKFNVVFPSKDYLYNNLGNTNETSISFCIEFKNFSLYTAGDLGKNNEIESITDINNPSEIDVLKIGHHGSKTSTSNELLQELTPLISIISVGKDNKYGHPSQEVLGILNNYETKILRTDTNGSIEISTDGNYLWGNTENTIIQKVQL